MSAPTLWGLLVSHWTLNPAPSAGVAACAAAYAWGVSRVRRWPMQRTAAFLAGLGSLLLALDSGIDAYDNRLLSVHMVQHMLLLLLAPLLLLVGRPAVLALSAAPRRGRRAIAGALATIRPATRPWCCLTVFYVVVVSTHLPAFYDATLPHPALHDLEHAGYLLAGLLVWWPMVDADPVPRFRLAGLLRLGYLFLAMLPMAGIGAYLNRHTAVVYAPYAAASHGLGVSALSDQAQAGAIMWVVGNSIMVLIGLWAVMAALQAEERRQRIRDARPAHTATPHAGGPGGARP